MNYALLIFWLKQKFSFPQFEMNKIIAKLTKKSNSLRIALFQNHRLAILKTSICFTFGNKSIKLLKNF